MKQVQIAAVLRDAINSDTRTQYQLAKDSGVSSTQIGRFVRDERSLTIESAGRLCAVLGLELTPIKATRRRPTTKKGTVRNG